MAKRLKVSRKDLLKEPDQFLSGSEKAMLYYTDNRGAVIGVVAMILIAGSSFFGFKYYQETQTLGNEALYFEMEKAVEKDSTSVAAAKAIWEKIGGGLQKERASLLLADIHFQNQEFGEAEELYSTVMSNSSQGQVNYQMAHLGLAHSYESGKDYKKAIGLFKSIIDASTAFPLFEVYWSLSRCYELDNDGSNALLILREMQIKFSQNPQVDRIEVRIKQLST